MKYFFIGECFVFLITFPKVFLKSMQFGSTNMPFKLTDTAREMACYIEEKIERVCLQGINKSEFVCLFRRSLLLVALGKHYCEAKRFGPELKLYPRKGLRYDAIYAETFFSCKVKKGSVSRASYSALSL